MSMNYCFEVSGAYFHMKLISHTSSQYYRSSGQKIDYVSSCQLIHLILNLFQIVFPFLCDYMILNFEMSSDLRIFMHCMSVCNYDMILSWSVHFNARVQPFSVTSYIYLMLGSEKSTPTSTQLRVNQSSRISSVITVR